jgi:hypothetical protein
MMFNVYLNHVAGTPPPMKGRRFSSPSRVYSGSATPAGLGAICFASRNGASSKHAPTKVTGSYSGCGESGHTASSWSGPRNRVPSLLNPGLVSRNAPLAFKIVPPRRRR